MPEENTNTEMSVAEYNASVEAAGIAPAKESADEPIVEKIDVVELPNDAAKADEVAEDIEPIEEVETETAKPADEDAADAEDFTFTENADADTLAREETEVLELYEIPAPIKQMIERRDAELDTLRQSVAVVESNGGTESVNKVFTAFSRLFEQTDGAPNAKPLVELMRSDYSSELPAIAEEIFAAPSVKYSGVSMFQEVLMDVFKATPEKVNQVAAFLTQEDYQLPVPPPPTPHGVDAKLREAYATLPEIKRFEVESLSAEILELEKTLAGETDEYYKTELREQLNTANRKLSAEVETIQDRQDNLDTKRQREAYQAQQQTESAQKFERQVIESYNTEVFTLMDTFAAELAPKLTFLDEAAQRPMANNILSRVNNALSFEFDEQGNPTVSPTADYYAKQLKAEGVDYDFKKGSELLQKHLQATRQVEALKNSRASVKAIENAEKIKRNVMQDIKLEERALLGKLTASFVKSSNTALDKKVKAVADKKQITRRVIADQKPSSGRSGSESLADIDRDRQRYNAQVKASLASGDLDGLRESYA